MLHSLLIFVAVFSMVVVFFYVPAFPALFSRNFAEQIRGYKSQSAENPNGKIKSHPFVACAALFWSNREPKRGKEDVSLCQEGGGQSGC